MRYAKGVKGKCERLYSKIVRAEGKCEWCGEKNYEKLQCSHIVSRRYANTAVLLDSDDGPGNAHCLCAGCHLKAHEWPVDFALFVFETIGDRRYKELKELAISKKKVDWKKQLSILTMKAKELGIET